MAFKPPPGPPPPATPKPVIISPYPTKVFGLWNRVVGFAEILPFDGNGSDPRMGLAGGGCLFPGPIYPERNCVLEMIVIERKRSLFIHNSNSFLISRMIDLFPLDLGVRRPIVERFRD